MKNNYLDGLLNKIVEYNKPDICYCKGFLYKENDTYYIKIVETMLGSFNFNQKVYLDEGDDVFIKKAEKPKLMSVSFKSWHYKLVKFIMGKNAPTPKTLQNGCPYFWLVIYSIILFPFVALGKLLWFILKQIGNILYWVLDQQVNNWINSMDDVEYYNKRYSNTWKYKLIDSYISSNQSKYDSRLHLYQSLKHPDVNINEVDSLIYNNYNTWKTTHREEEIEKAKIRLENYNKHKLKRDKRRKTFKNFFKPIGNFFIRITKNIKNPFKAERSKINTIVKRTKNVVGIILTISFGFLSYFVVNLLSRLTMFVVDICIENWVILLAGLILGSIILIIWGIFHLLEKLFIYINNKYKNGKKVWYIEGLKYTIWYPIKYVGLGIYYMLYMPIKYIIWDIIWDLLIRNAGIGIGRFFVYLWKILLSSTGIFGEYLGSSYTDYCPGIEWTDYDEESEKE